MVTGWVTAGTLKTTIFCLLVFLLLGTSWLLLVVR